MATTAGGASQTRGTPPDPTRSERSKRDEVGARSCASEE